jgi:hypothetical protein
MRVTSIMGVLPMIWRTPGAFCAMAKFPKKVNEFGLMLSGLGAKVNHDKARDFNDLLEYDWKS